MSKVKILKELPKTKAKDKPKINITATPKPKQTNQFTEKYLQYYDDIKIPSKRYDW